MEHLTDAPIANILILAGVIFLAVALFGKIGGFIGTIFGNIEAGKNSRILGGVFGLALIVGGVWMHTQDKPGKPSPPTSNTSNPIVTPSNSQPAQAATQPGVPRKVNAPPEQADEQVANDLLVGKWLNQSPGPKRLHSFQIERTGRNFTIHLWAACDPSDCDGGIHELAVTGNSAIYQFAVGNERRTGTITLERPGLLAVTIDRLDLSTLQTLHNHWQFAKSN